MKPRIVFLTLFFCSVMTANAQRIIEPGGFWYETEYTTDNIGDVDPDSVYVFSHWGSGEFTGEDDPAVPVETLLKCRNLQKLVLRSCSVPTLLASLDRFPLLQELELWDTDLGSLPEKVAELKNLRILTVSDVSFEGEESFDPERWKDNKIIYFTEVKSGCTPEGEMCVLNFAAFPNLTYLSLENSNVTNLASLKNCTKLNKLDVRDCENLRSIGYATWSEVVSVVRIRGIPEEAFSDVQAIDGTALCDGKERATGV